MIDLCLHFSDMNIDRKNRSDLPALMSDMLLSRGESRVKNGVRYLQKLFRI